MTDALLTFLAAYTGTFAAVYTAVLLRGRQERATRRKLLFLAERRDQAFYAVQDALIDGLRGDRFAAVDRSELLRRRVDRDQAMRDYSVAVDEASK